MDYESGLEPTLASGSKGQEPSPLTGSADPPPGHGERGTIIDLYLAHTSDAPSPRMFRLWTAIHAVGAAAERRVWTSLGINRLHPNLFVFLVGPPGVGKSQAINPMSVLLRKSQAVNLAPDDMSKQGLLDALGDSGRGTLIAGRPFDYHFLAICISELSNFMAKYDVELAGLLTHLFDCPPTNDEKKRSGAGKMIPFPGISFIMGTATKNLGETISDAMWGSGFMARVVMVFSADDVVPANMFHVVPENEAVRDGITTGLRRIGDMKGEMAWDLDAQLSLQSFRQNQKDGAPLHNRLEYYVTRRWMHLAKLCMIAALADERMDVTIGDFLQAREWLLEAERAMPEVFKDMVGHEDGQIYEEMRSQMFALSMRAHVPITHTMLVQFLSKRVSAHNVERMLQIAVAADYFRREAGTGFNGEEALYIPQASFGVKPLDIL